MNTLKNAILSTFMIFGMLAVTVPSHAILIEPILGYGTSTFDAGSGDDNPSNLYYGIRLGTDIVDLGFASLFTAIDYKTGSGEFSILGIDSDYTHTTTALDIGLDLPLVRAWLGYNFTNKIEFDNPLFGDDFEGDGAITLGVSVGVIPFIEINAEYMTSDDSGADLDFLLLSVSFPLDL